MAKDYIDDDYVISYYSSSAQEYTTSYPSSSVVETVITQSTSVDILNNYTWIQATGTAYDDDRWQIISGTSEIIQLNPNNSSDAFGNAEIGHRIEIVGSQIFTNLYLNVSSTENNGIAIYDSSSSGYFLSDYVNIPTSSVSNGDARNIGIEFSADGSYLVAPVKETYVTGEGGKLLIFKSSSVGWNIETTLTTGTFNAGSPYPISTRQENAYFQSVIKGDTIFANGFVNSSYDRFVALFKSSSSGWAFEDQVQIAGLPFPASQGESGNTAEFAGRIGNSRVNFDFDGNTGVLGSKHANPNRTSPYGDNGDDSSGRVHIIESGSSGWYQTKVGLESLGLTGGVDPSIGIPTASFGEDPEEWYTFQRFGLESCAVSGNYIAATAIAKGFYDSSDSLYHWRKNAVFILKSGSSGWQIEAQLDDPADSTTYPLSGSGNTAFNGGRTAFGYGISFGLNSIVINSPKWASDPIGYPNRNEGRVYVFVSKSASGWELNQTIDNPYKDSIFHYPYYPLNGYLGGPSVPNNSGGAHMAATPKIVGNILVVPAPEFNAWPDAGGVSSVLSGSERVYYDSIGGAVVVFEGLPEYRQETTEEVITQSSETITYITTSGGPVPFRLGGSRNAGNIRDQDENNSYSHYKP